MGALGDTQPSWVAKVKVSGVETLAIVDSGAEVSLIFNEFYDKMSDKPDIVSETAIRTVIQGEGAKVFRTGPIDLEIDGHLFKHSVRVGLTREDMILGMDVFAPHGHKF